MATFDYAQSQNTSDRLITKIRPVRRDPAASARRRPCLRSRAWNSHQLSGAIGRAGVHQPLDRRRAHRSGDRRAYVSNKGVSIEPKPGDVIVEANVVRTWRVVNVQSVAPAGIVVFWDLQARA